MMKTGRHRADIRPCGKLRVGSSPTIIYEASALRTWQIVIDNKSIMLYNTCIDSEKSLIVL